MTESGSPGTQLRIFIGEKFADLVGFTRLMEHAAHGKFSIGKWRKGWGLGRVTTESGAWAQESASPLATDLLISWGLLG